MPFKTCAKSILCLALIAPNYLQAANDCRQIVAKVASAQGIVVVRPYQSKTWQRLHTDDEICSGATIRTLIRSRATLIESSLAVITLDQHSTMTFTSPPAPDKVSSWFIDLLEGKVFFRSREPQHLDIHTPFINAVHKGTEFMVAVNDRQAEITVFDGKVAGENSRGKVTVDQGFTGIAQANHPPKVQALKITPEDAVQWALYYPPIIDDSQIGTATSNNVLNSAFIAYRQGDYHQALENLDSISADQQSSQYFSFKAALLLTVGRVDEAQIVIQQIQRLEPNNADAFALQSVIAVSKNQQQTALQLADKAVAAKPDSAIAKIAQSYAYQALLNVDDALKVTEEATRLSPNNALAWARLSELQLSQGDHDAALNSAKKAQTLNPKIGRTQTILGFANLAETEIDDAKRAFEQALSMDSSDPLARLGLGLAKIRQGDLEEGKTELETAVNLDPNNAVIRSYLGKAYYELRNKDYAGTEYKIAKQMDPKDPTPWFYDAILKQTTNRPVEALHDMDKAIVLNDNRGVYRSKLLLDKDTATRQVGLGRIFNNLGFDDPANRQAMKSLAIDPINYSAHRLLSDSYLTKPRHEIARVSEYLQSQLLQPLNYNPVQPSLAYTDLNIIKGIGPNETAFNEYNRLFERNGIRFTTTGVYGSNSTLGDETALSGILNKFSFSLGQLHYQTDGFRPNNAIKHNIYNAFAQYEISPSINIQAEYRHRETVHGDLEFKGDASTISDFNRNLEQDSYRAGLKISPSKNSDFLLSLLHANRTEFNHFHGSDSRLNTKSYNLEGQHLFRNDLLNTVLGAGIYQNDYECQSCGLTTDFNTNRYFGYFYANSKAFKSLTVTTGVSYDFLRSDEPLYGFEVNELNPKLGLIWQANPYLTFRAAGFKVVKSSIVDGQTLQPTQIAGFNQYYDDFTGSTAWQYGIGVDSHFFKNIYAGLEAYKRDVKSPINPSYSQKHDEELYRFYLNWTPFSYVAVNSEFRFENFRYTVPNSGNPNNNYSLFPNAVETTSIPLELRFFEPTGFFASLKGTYVNQRVVGGIDPGVADFFGGNFRSEFYLVDAAVGYRFPKQYGLISFEAKNLFDTRFKYRDRRFYTNEQRMPDYIPERLLFARITLNF